MERREAVKYISILLGGTLVGADAFLTGCKTKTGKPVAWQENEVAYLNEIGETILPQTSTPGAKAANVGQFMTVYVNDCYEEIDQRAFREGLNKLDDASRKKFDKNFMEITPAQRTELLKEVDTESKTFQKQVNEFNDKETAREKEETAKGNLKYKKQRKASHYFTMMKGLTLLGFFTSEAGSKAVRYVPTPGRYDACIPYTRGEKMFI
jgi:hypothetical protein